MQKKFTAAILAAVMLLVPLSSAGSVRANQADMMSEEKSALEAKLSAIQGEVKELEKKNDGLESKLDDLKDQDLALESEYKQLTSEMELAAGVVDQAISESEEAIANVEKQKAAYEERIVVMFQYQRKSTLEVLLESDSLNGFFTNMRLMEYVADADNQLLEDLKIAQEVAEVKQSEAEETVAEYKTFIAQKQEQLDNLSKGISLVEQDIDSLDNEILNRTNEAGQVQDLIEEVDAQLAAFYEQMKREAEAAKAAEESRKASEEASSLAASREAEAARAAEESRREAAESERKESLRKEAEAAKSREAELSKKLAEQPDDSSLASEIKDEEEKLATISEKLTATTSPTTTKAPTTTTTAIPQTTGKYIIMPLTSYHYLSSPYGYRTHPITGVRGSFHYGTDWSANAGTPVRAAKGGTIAIANKPYQGQVYTSHRSGYGNYITINHGDGTSTTYAHLSYVEVSVGQTVAQGERIGKVGSTGASTGPHLHFEYAINGSTVDPMKYIQ